MLLGEVTGNIVSTRKNEKLIGFKLLAVQIVDNLTNSPREIIVVDNVGAGVGEKVLVALGSAARKAVGEDTPVDAAAVGIVDPT